MSCRSPSPGFRDEPPSISRAVASAEQPPGQRLRAIEVETLLKKTRQADYVGLDYPKLPRLP